ncbi:glycosyltransferase family 2 protein [Rhizobium sp. AAP43]|uniref:glycosyltransferase family 2 protein n=1 Tax=Rhizobium sp. AAP43 TaxID=1523420 RepID=UPI0009EC1C46|nr:glycosyltransferase family 2 protein [Rhizobium sp. AAP43]
MLRAKGDRHPAAGNAGPPFNGIGELKAEARLLHRLGIAKPLIARMADRAAKHRTTIEQELLASGAVQEDAYYAGLARMFGFTFLDVIPADLVTDLSGLDSQLKQPRLLRLHYPDRPPVMVVVPEIRTADALARRLSRGGDMAGSVVVATPSAVRSAVWAAGARRRSREAVGGLFESARSQSARLVVTGEQGFLAGLLASVLIVVASISPMAALLVLHIVMSLFHLAALALRMMVIQHSCQQEKARRRQGGTSEGHVAAPEFQSPDGPLPVYTVMVAIYREAAVVPQLLTALSALDWPKSLLDIKIVCEADDQETLAALQAARTGPQFEVVAVPSSLPRTKPKALTYALAGARGEFLTIYDAEDRPDPQQLREAYHTFRLGPPDLACLQAPLAIANGGESWISAIFALEYSALFRKLLPALGHHRLPMPLGGTSNHFKTQALVKSGGWDPYNVTEDADLGMRLYRAGYRASTITSPTLEDAPTHFKVWLGQRTRWYKGWLQTWLVLMRSPARTAQEMGLGAFLVFQLLVGGMLVAALTHPALILFIAVAVTSLREVPIAQTNLMTTVLLAIDLINILGSYAIFFVLGALPMSGTERKSLGHRWILIPVYWMGVSLAAWKAAIELRFKPFYWNKTPHSPSRAATTTAGLAQPRKDCAAVTSSGESV